MNRLNRFPARVVARLVTVAVLSTAAVAAALVAASPVFAADPTYLAVNTIPQVLDQATKWLMGILAAVATLFLTIGGVRYVAAGGDPGEVEKAKSAFKSAGVGYALAALAPIVVGILKSILGVA
jgi:Type IV secretion system pilin